MQLDSDLVWKKHQLQKINEKTYLPEYIKYNRILRRSGKRHLFENKKFQKVFLLKL